MTKPVSDLTKMLANAIQQRGGVISFAAFMQAALYDPEHGYYNSRMLQLGKTGDFTTASEISPLYAQCFAKQCQEILRELPNGSLLELGAGSGRFAGALLNELAKSGIAIPHYYICEISPALREQQQTNITKNYPGLLKHISWVDEVPPSFNGVIIANEVLDALPVHCFRIENDSFKERGVTFANDHFAWKLAEPDPILASAGNHLQREVTLENGYESEISLAVPPFVTQLCERLQQGVILFADYGYGRAEYYHPHRNHGTLTCFYQHQKHDDPLILPGKQDITAHVDFTLVIENADAAGCELAGYTTQAAFLLNCGLSELAIQEEQTLNPADLFKLHQAIKLLTMPTEMGERVKVMALSKNFSISLLGFRTQDKRHEL